MYVCDMNMYVCVWYMYVGCVYVVLCDVCVMCLCMCVCIYVCVWGGCNHPHHVHGLLPFQEGLISPSVFLRGSPFPAFSQIQLYCPGVLFGPIFISSSLQMPGHILLLSALPYGCTSQILTIWSATALAPLLGPSSGFSPFSCYHP